MWYEVIRNKTTLKLKGLDILTSNLYDQPKEYYMVSKKISSCFLHSTYETVYLFHELNKIPVFFSVLRYKFFLAHL